MADELLQTKIKEALIATGHNRQDAPKLLLTWAIRDPALLLTLTKPHLKALAASAVEAHLRASETNGKPPVKPRTAIDDVVASAAVHLPMDQRKPSTLPPPQSTARQASAMRKLADAFGKKKK